MAPRETENNAYAKFWGDKKRALWYHGIFWSDHYLGNAANLEIHPFM